MINSSTPNITNHNSQSLSGIAFRLVLDGVLERQEAQDLVQKAKDQKIPFVNYLVKQKLVAAKIIAHSAAHDFGIPLFDLDAFDIELIPKELVKEDLIRTYNALPLQRRGEVLFIATADPTNQEGFNQIKFQTGYHTMPIIVEADKLEKLLEHVLDQKQAAALGDINDTDLDALDFSTESDAELAKDDNSDADDAPIVRFINKILLDAIKKGSSDIHFEVYEKECRIRFRTDGILYEIAKPPLNLANRLVARLKVMSRLDISERRVPQDGRFKMKLSRNHSIDFRISTCPTIWGEKIVTRILDPSSVTLGIDALGYDPVQKDLFLGAIQKPQGMILVTGPTGSGKSVSLYTALNILNTTERNVSTVEDPVEINLPGINQVNVNLKTNLTFSAALRSFLRQDPDVIMVGEMRDLETAEIGIKAAQTGHLVLSTLHTNSAAETITRLLNMGVAPFNVATSINLIIAQRLARRLCEKCKQPHQLPKESLLPFGFTERELSTLNIFKPVGCDACNNGYKGRVGLYEVMPFSKPISQAVLAGQNSITIAEIAQQEGMLTLYESGLNKVRLGITSLEEINRVTTG